MVADDDVDSEGIGQVYLIYGLDSAVDGDDEGHSGLAGVLYALRGYSVSLVVPVRNVEVHVLREFGDEAVKKCHGGGAVHVVISIDHYLFVIHDGLVQSFHCLVHIAHKEWVVKVIQVRTEKGPALLESLYASFYEEVGEHLVYAHFRTETFDFFSIRGFFYYPFALFCHLNRLLF